MPKEASSIIDVIKKFKLVDWIKVVVLLTVFFILYALFGNSIDNSFNSLNPTIRNVTILLLFSLFELGILIIIHSDIKNGKSKLWLTSEFRKDKNPREFKIVIGTKIALGILFGLLLLFLLWWTFK